MHFQTDEMVISTIKMATNWSSNIMWIEVGEDTVNRLLHRAAVLKNPHIQLVTFIPSGLWNRKKDLNQKMKEQRIKEPRLRYQITVGKNDIILKTKMVGEFKLIDNTSGGIPTNGTDPKLWRYP